MSARERARALVEAENDAATARWEAEYAVTAPRQRPKRPSRLDAPPLGCPDHPHGTFGECGPCGLVMERRRTFLDRERYQEKLALFEESRGEVGFDESVF